MLYNKQETPLSHWVLIVPLREINSSTIRPFHKLSNGVSHMQINAAVSEIQRLEQYHSKLLPNNKQPFMLLTMLSLYKA